MHFKGCTMSAARLFSIYKRYSWQCVIAIWVFFPLLYWCCTWTHLSFYKCGLFVAAIALQTTHLNASLWQICILSDIASSSGASEHLASNSSPQIPASLFLWSRAGIQIMSTGKKGNASLNEQMCIVNHLLHLMKHTFSDCERAEHLLSIVWTKQTTHSVAFYRFFVWF